MPVDVLSQDDIDELLTCIGAGDPVEDAFDARHHRKDSRRIKIYDFKRPDLYNKDIMRAVAQIHEVFVRLTSVYLTHHFATPVHCHVASCDQLSYEEYILAIPTPTCMSIINMDPIIKGNILLELEPAFAFALLERAFGGSGDLTPTQHTLTTIEENVLERIIIRLLGNIREAWIPYIDLRPRLGQMETQPQFARIADYSDMVVMVTIEAKIDDLESMLSFCLPSTFMSAVMFRLLPIHKQPLSSSKSAFNHEVMRSSLFEVRALLCSTFTSLASFYALDVGDTIYTANYTDQVFALYINDLVIATYNYDPLDLSDKIKIRINVIAYGKEVNMETRTMIDTSHTFGDIRVPLIIELGRTSKTLDEISIMGEGTVFELDKLAGEPVDIFANNVCVAKGEVVVIGENFGIRVVDVINKTPLKQHPHDLEEEKILQEQRDRAKEIISGDPLTLDQLALSDVPELSSLAIRPSDDSTTGDLESPIV